MIGRDLLLLVKSAFSQQSLEDAVKCLHKILLTVECNTIFCQSHELVVRTKITAKAFLLSAQ